MPLSLEGAAPAALDGELAIVQLGGKRYLHNRLSGELVLLQVAPGERVGVVHSHEVGFLPQFLVQLAALVEPGLLQKDIVEISQGSCFSMIACLLKPKVAKK